VADSISTLGGGTGLTVIYVAAPVKLRHAWARCRQTEVGFADWKRKGVTPNEISTDISRIGSLADSAERRQETVMFSA